MKICSKPFEKDTIPEWIPGHIYQWESSDELYLATNEHQLVNLNSGRLFTKKESQLQSITHDVTNKYCLQRIKS